MEEDIKILEDYIEVIKKGYCEDCNELCNIYGAPTYPAKKISEATEHLIKGYKDGEDILIKTTKENLELKEHIREVEENLKIATAMLTKGQYPEINKGDNDFNKQFVTKSKIKKLKEENEINIDKMRPYRHQGPFNFGVLNGIDECCRILLVDK